MIFNSVFKEKFTTLSEINKDRIIKRLLSLFDLPEDHFCRATMYRYYFKYPKIEFNKEIASKILFSFFQEGSFSIVDYTCISKSPSSLQLTFVTDSYDVKEGHTAILNWMKFLTDLEDKHWEKFPLLLEKVDFFEDREPKNLREKVLYFGVKDSHSDKFLSNKYLFFNINFILNYYEKLISLYFPEYLLIKKVSKKKLKRYGKKIGEKSYLGFCIDYSALESELKMGYIEFPIISIEIFSIDMIEFPSEKKYLNGSTESPIIRVKLFYFMGNFIDNRVGNSSESSELLQKKLHFHFVVNSFYTKIYLEEIEFIVSHISPSI